jgi:hypothetical protein
LQLDEAKIANGEVRPLEASGVLVGNNAAKPIANALGSGFP